MIAQSGAHGIHMNVVELLTDEFMAPDVNCREFFHPDSVSLTRLERSCQRKLLKWLRSDGHLPSLEKLALARPLQSGQTHAVWMKEFSAIDIWSHKFIRQKLHYIHMNPVRAGLCDHPAKWRWSSYHAYLPHEPGSVPIEIDWRWLWTEEELSLAREERTSPQSKR